MAKFLLQVYSSLRDFLSPSLYCIIKPLMYKKIEIGKHGRESNKDNQPAAYSYSRWQNIQVDIMENIVKRLKGTDLARMACVCMSWRETLVLYKGIWITAPDIPWLLLPQGSDRKSLSFYSMSEERVYNMKLPKTAQGGRVCGSSKRWLAIVKGSDLDPHMFLLNPISGEQINLPSLTTVPYFDDFVGRRPKHYNASTFVSHIEVFSAAGTAGCMVVAAIINVQSEGLLALCKPGDERWSIFEGAGDEVSYFDILFHDKSLYAITDRVDESVSTHTICLTDCEVELKLILCQGNDVGHDLEDVEDQPGLVIAKDLIASAYLAESIHGELLKICHNTDAFAIDDGILEDDELEEEVEEEEDGYMVEDEEEGEQNDEIVEEEGEEEEEDRLFRFTYFKTKGFEIFKLNPNSGKMEKLTSLDDQVLFVASIGGSLSLPVRNMDGLKGNCIYFAATTLQTFLQRYMNISRESGVFYLEDGRIERCFPSITFPGHSHLSWFKPFPQ